jgi:metallophosphoesterase (TIGR00282 family)
MRILFIGDIVGKPGVEAVTAVLPGLVESEAVDLVIANAENACGGAGLTCRIYRRLRAAGVAVLTLGDHIYKQADVLRLLAEEEPVVKPANFPPEAPGREAVIVPARDGTPVGVFSLLGRLYMRPVDCPFKAADRVLNHFAGKTRCIVVDVHAEATGDKAALGRYLDGKVSAVLGTHTHVPTADECIFPGGTAFLTDVGMTGPYESILGRRIECVLQANLTFLPIRYDVATGDPRLAGVVVDIRPEDGRAVAIRRIMVPASGTAPAP